MSRLIKEMIVIALGVLAALYLLNPTFGVFELIPDAIPVIGNLDEAGATLILLNVFRYYGFDLQKLFGKRSDPQLPAVRHDPRELNDRG
ncbi:MAG: DUF1232 domain-containing protein [Chloroflexi bacterium]|nr:DUF1232 domain-containing protein [Chloroflexota bacterium]